MCKARNHTWVSSKLYLSTVASIALILLLLPVVTLAQTAQTEELSSSTAVSTEETAIKETKEKVWDDSWYQEDDIPGGGRVFGDFVVGPGKIELSIEPGESMTVPITVTNRTGELREFKLEIEDTAASREPGQTVTLLGDERGPYSIKDLISIPQYELRLAHNSRATIPVTITVPADAEAGGRYGSVLVKTVAIKSDIDSTQALRPQSPIEARIGTLFFLTIPGETEKSGQLTEFNTIPNQQWFQKGPIKFGIMFENTGSIHLTPRGSLSITNMFGQEVGFVQLEPWFAMPGSLRFREVIWNSEYLVGRYTATVEIDRSYDEIVDTMTITFWVLPWKLMVAFFAGVFVLVFLLRAFFKKFEFRRKS